MNDPRWIEVDEYFAKLLLPPNDPAAGALEANRQAGLPAIDVSPLQGKLLFLLARLMSARNILEVGTLGGYSTIWLARALPPGGRVVTLEVEPKHAAVARANLERAGLAEVVELRVGPAAAALRALEAEGRGPFDLIFIDADKPAYPEYLELALQLSRPGTLLIADNVVRGGGISQPANDDPRVLGVRRFVEMLAADPRVNATVIQTVGSKGYDGFAIALIGQ